MAYRFRRRMRQIGIGYRVKTVIIANELFRNNKKKGESNNYEIIMIGKKKKKKKKYFKRRREIFQEANTIFFFFPKDEEIYVTVLEGTWFTNVSQDYTNERQNVLLSSKV